MLIGSTQAHLLRIEELRGELATVLGKAEAAKEGPENIRAAIARQRGSIEAMIRTHEANLVSIDASRRLHGKLRTELGRGIDLLSPNNGPTTFGPASSGCGTMSWPTTTKTLDHGRKNHPRAGDFLPRLVCSRGWFRGSSHTAF